MASLSSVDEVLWSPRTILTVALWCACQRPAVKVALVPFYRLQTEGKSEELTSGHFQQEEPWER